METRHALHRSLRSSGVTPLQHTAAKSRNTRGRPTKVTTATTTFKGRQKGSRTAETEKSEDAEDKTSDTDLQDSIDDCPPSPSSDDVREEESETSKAPSPRRSRSRGFSVPQMRARSLHNLKSRVDWSRNAEEGLEDTSSVVIDDDQASATSSVSLRSKSTESPSQSPAAKLLGSTSTTGSRSKSARLSAVGRLRNNTPAQAQAVRSKSNLVNVAGGKSTSVSSSTGRNASLVNPAANTSVTSTSAGKSTPSPQASRLKASAVAVSDVSTKDSSSVTRAQVATLDETSTKKSSRGANQAMKAISTTKSTCLKRSGQQRQNEAQPEKSATLSGSAKDGCAALEKQVKELRKTPMGRVTRTSSNSPVTRTRATKSRQAKVSPSKPCDSKTVTKDDSSMDNNLEVEATESEDMATTADQSEETEGDGDCVTRAAICSSSSPEIDHNYAKPEVADGDDVGDAHPPPSSSKVTVVGKSSITKGGPLSESASGGAGTGQPDDSEAHAERLNIRKRVRRGVSCAKNMEAAAHQPVLKETTTMEPKPSAMPPGKGVVYVGRKSTQGLGESSGRTSSSGIGASILTLEGAVCAANVSVVEDEVVPTFTPPKGKKTYGSPISKVNRQKLLRQRKPNSKYVLQMIKGAIYHETKVSHGHFKVSQAKAKAKTKLIKSGGRKGDTDDNDEYLPPLSDVKTPRTSFPERKFPDRNLFEEFSRDTASSSEDGGSLCLEDSQDSSEEHCQGIGVADSNTIDLRVENDSQKLPEITHVQKQMQSDNLNLQNTCMIHEPFTAANTDDTNPAHGNLSEQTSQCYDDTIPTDSDIIQNPTKTDSHANKQNRAPITRRISRRGLRACPSLEANPSLTMPVSAMSMVADNLLNDAMSVAKPTTMKLERKVEGSESVTITDRTKLALSCATESTASESSVGNHGPPSHSLCMGIPSPTAANIAPAKRKDLKRAVVRRLRNHTRRAADSEAEAAKRLCLNTKSLLPLRRPSLLLEMPVSGGEGSQIKDGTSEADKATNVNTADYHNTTEEKAAGQTKETDTIDTKPAPDKEPSDEVEIAGKEMKMKGNEAGNEKDESGLKAEVKSDETPQIKDEANDVAKGEGNDSPMEEAKDSEGKQSKSRGRPGRPKGTTTHSKAVPARNLSATSVSYKWRRVSLRGKSNTSKDIKQADRELVKPDPRLDKAKQDLSSKGTAVKGMDVGEIKTQSEPEEQDSKDTPSAPEIASVEETAIVENNDAALLLGKDVKSEFTDGGEIRVSSDENLQLEKDKTRPLKSEADDQIVPDEKVKLDQEKLLLNEAATVDLLPVTKVKGTRRRISLRGKAALMGEDVQKPGMTHNNADVKPSKSHSKVNKTDNDSAKKCPVKETTKTGTATEIKLPVELEPGSKTAEITLDTGSLDQCATPNESTVILPLEPNMKAHSTDVKMLSDSPAKLQLEDEMLPGDSHSNADADLQVLNNDEVEKQDNQKLQPKEELNLTNASSESPLNQCDKELAVIEMPIEKSVSTNIKYFESQIAQTRSALRERRRPGRPPKRMRSVGITPDKKREMFKAMIEKEVKSADEKKESAVIKLETPGISTAFETTEQDKVLGNVNIILLKKERKNEHDSMPNSEAVVVHSVKISEVEIEEDTSLITTPPSIGKRSRGRPRRLSSAVTTTIEAGGDTYAANCSEDAYSKGIELVPAAGPEESHEEAASDSKKMDASDSKKMESPEMSDTPESKELDSGNEGAKAIWIQPVMYENLPKETIRENSHDSRPTQDTEASGEKDIDSDEIEIEPAVITMVTVPQEVSPPKRKRGRPAKSKSTSSPGVLVDKSAAIFKQPVRKEETPRPVSRWKIPPPSPIRTRRLSKETSVTWLTPPTYKRSLNKQFVASKEPTVEDEYAVKDSPTDYIKSTAVVEDASGGMEDHDPLKTSPVSSTGTDQDRLSDVQGESQVAQKLEIPDDDASTSEGITTQEPVLADKAKELEVSSITEDSSHQEESVASLSSANSIVDKESEVTHSKDTESQESCVQFANVAVQQPTDEAFVTENNDSPTVTTKKAEAGVLVPPESLCSLVKQDEQQQLFTKVDDLQVPFHDTDEAEQSEILSIKSKAHLSTGETIDDTEDLDLYLEIESNHSDEMKDISVEAVKEGSNETNIQRAGNDPLVSETVSTSTTTEPDAFPQKVCSADKERINLKEDGEVESIFLKEGNEGGANVESPSKSEWCARKVTTGMKIVLKLKRKGSSERGENSAPSTPTLTDQKPMDQKHMKAASASPAGKESREMKRDDPSKKPIDSIASDMLISSDLSQVSSLIDDWRKKKKRRRNEVEMLNVIDRVYHKKKKEDHSEPTADDSEISGFTSDSTMGTQSSSTADKDATMPLVDTQIDIKTEVEAKTKPEVKVEGNLEVTEEQPGSSGGQCNEVHQQMAAEPEQVEQKPSTSKADQPQKVEKLVIKRRVPSPTKMKTRGKQNRLWYLFAKQSKPTKEFSVEPRATKEPKAAPIGTLQELKAMCKPCSIRLVDIIELLGVMSGETATVTDEPEDLSVTNNMEMENEPLWHSLDEKIGMGATHSHSLQVGQGVKRKYSPSKEATSKTSPLQRAIEEGNLPIVKKSKLQPGSEFERQYLSFIMPHKVPAPVLDNPNSSEPIEATVKITTLPKPVLTRGTVTARKTMRSGPRKQIQTPLCIPKELDSNNSLKEKGQISPGISPNGKFACLHCPYTSNVRSVILEHVYIHTDVVPYACGHCNEAYGSRNGVTIHTKREHPGISPDIVKNTEVCEEDYYVTCDQTKRPCIDFMQSSLLAPATHSDLPRQVEAPMQPLISPTSIENAMLKGRSVSLLNPAILTAQVAATNVGLGSGAGSPSNSVNTSAVQLVVTTSRPVSTGPIVNVVAQVDATGSTLPMTMSFEANSGRKMKIPRRPRIPSLVNVDPTQPYYQCRHCTFANNDLLSIKVHVEMLHKGDQCYQCRQCDLAFFKDSQLMEKHYLKNHPGEPVVYQLQSQFYDVHQNTSDKTGADSLLLAAQNRGQSPLHVIVSADGVTLLGAPETSPVSGIASSQVSPAVTPGTAQGLTSPVPPAHSRPQPVLSPIAQGLAPPPAHGGNSLALSPLAAANKLESSKEKAARCILRVPTISPLQRPAAAQRAPAVSHSGIVKPHMASLLPVQTPSVPTSSSEPDVLNLTVSASNTSPGLDLIHCTPRQDVVLQVPATLVALDLHRKFSPERVEVAAGDGAGDGAEVASPVAEVEMQTPEKGPSDTDSVTKPEDSPPPFKIMNVMSLAGQLDPDSVEPEPQADAVAPHEVNIAEIFTCTRCGASFNELVGITDHIGNEHKLQYWYACPYCPFGCSWGKMLSHISRSHSGEYHEVPLAIIEEEKYFIRKRLDKGAPGPVCEIQQCEIQQCEIQPDDEQVTGSDPNSDMPDVNADSSGAFNVESRKVSSTAIPKGVEPKTSEIGCGTDDLPTPPVPSRVLEEEDVVIVSEHRKQRPVGQIRPTMVRVPVVKAFRRIAPAVSFPQLIQPVSPITTDKPSPEKTLPSSLDTHCENIDDPQHLADVTEDDDVIVTETQSSVINITATDRPLDLHTPKRQTPSRVLMDEPTDLSFSSLGSQRQALADEPQDLSVPQNAGQGHLQQARSASSSPSVIQTRRADLQSPPPAHQSITRNAVAPLVIEPIAGGFTGARLGQQAWGTPIMIAPLPQSPENTTSPRQPQAAHSHNRSQHTGRFEKPSGLQTLSAKVGAPSLPPPSHKSGDIHVPSVSTAPQRSVPKAMPPLMHIASNSSSNSNMSSSSSSSGGNIISISSSTTNTSTRKSSRPPPPLIHVRSSHSSSSTARTSNSSVIQAVPGGSQSALTSLEMMTNQTMTSGGYYSVTSTSTSMSSSQRVIDDEVVDKEAMRKAYSVFNLKPRMQKRNQQPTAPPSLHHQPPPAHFAPTGINKWKQFQSQNRPTIRPSHSALPFGPRSAATGFPGPRPGSLGLAAAAFQQAHLRRAGVNPAQLPVLPQMSSATAAAAAASFMQQRQGVLAQQQQPAFSSADKPMNVPCPYCPFEAEDPDTIHNHILTHAPNIQWSCPYCPMPNRMTKAAITKHMQNCHPTNNVVYIPYGVPLNLA